MLSPKPQWMTDDETNLQNLRRGVNTPLLSLLAEQMQPKHPYIAKGLQGLQKGMETLPMLLMGTPAGLMGQGMTAAPYTKPKVSSRPLWDVERGMGNMGATKDVAAGWNGFVRDLTPDQFLSLAETINLSSGLAKQKKASLLRGLLEERKSVSPPTLWVDWNSEKGAWQVTAHEGRHRASLLGEFKGQAKIPVHIFTDERPQELTKQQRRAGFIPQTFSKQTSGIDDLFFRDDTGKIIGVNTSEKPYNPHTKPLYADTRKDYVKPKVLSWPEKLRNTIGSIEYADKYSKTPELKTKALEHAYKMQEHFKTLYGAAQKEFADTPKEAGSKIRYAILEKQGDAAANAQFWREAIELLEGRGDYLKR